jgi:hypothetical protein
VLAVGKILKTISMVAAIGAAIVATGGLALFGTTVGITLLGVSASTLTLVSLGAGIASVLLTPKPKLPGSQISRLSVLLDPSAPRKAVFGTTAMPLDMRYHESSGANQEYVDYIIAVAAHKIASINEIWFEEKLAWSSAGGVAATYVGYLTNIDIVTEGNASNYISINGGSKWGASRRLTGCAYVHLRIKRTGNVNTQDSPLVNGLPSRVTIIGDGALLYDPRKDSTVPGGSGSHRANDQSTWGAYTNADDTDNPALQLLWWLLGWKINNKLSVGCGVPYTRIDMESFITAANICDENVTLAIGGTQKRYRTSGTASDNDGRMEIISNFLASMSATIRDNSGKLMLTVMKNDLADYALILDESDMIGPFDWQQTGGLTDNYNVARGRYVDPSPNSLYQIVDYPEVGFASPDGIDRVMSLELFYIEDGRRAQRIAKQALQRNQYRGTFTTTFNSKALGCQVGDIIWMNLASLGWLNKPFRVISQEIRFDGQVPMSLIEEDASIYAWDSNESAPLTATAPTIYNPLNNPLILAITDAEAVLDGKIASFYQATAPTADGIGDIWFDTDDGNAIYRWNGVSWADAKDTEITIAINTAANAEGIAVGKVKTFYQTTAPTAEAIGDLWMDSDDKNKMYRWSGSAWVSVRDAGKVTTFYASTTPTAEAIGDLWYNTTTLILLRWNGSAWQNTANFGATAAQISAIDAAQLDADNALALADSKIETFFQTTAPTGASVGDLWFDTDDENKLYRYSGSTWVLAQDGTIADAITSAAGAQATADSKIVTFFATTTPTAEAIGDLWYDSSTLLLKRWSGSAWVNTATNGAPSGTTVGGRDADTIAGTIKTDGIVNTDKVNTASVLNNSITKTTTVASSTSVTIASTTDGDPANWTVVQSVAVTTTGGDIVIAANFNAICQEGPTSTFARFGVQYALYLDSAALTQVARAQATVIPAMTSYFDVPVTITAVRSGLAAGTYTARIYARRIGDSVAGSGASTSTATRSLVLTEFKK